MSKVQLDTKQGRMIRDLAEVAVYQLEHSGYKAGLRRALRLPDRDEPYPLPAGNVIPCYPLACLPGAPESWVQGPGSYVVPVDTECGLWFDWTMNDNHNTAIVASVKGMNPITGQKLESLRLEQYRDKCPIHDTPFSHGRYCEKCGYTWPPQGYVSYPNVLWWDGFRNPDGTVRQFFFTDEDRRDVASAIIGKENTVPAFGFAFFHCKKERLIQPRLSRFGGVTGQSVTGQSMTYSCDDIKMVNSACYTASLSGETKGVLHTNSVKCSAKHGFTGPTGETGPTGPLGARGVEGASGDDSLLGFIADNQEAIAASMVSPKRRSESRALKGTPESRRTKDVSVGAGAKIRQDLEVDPLSLDDWHAEPKGLIRLYFVFAEQLQDIYERGGVKELVSKPEGYLAGVPVG